MLKHKVITNRIILGAMMLGLHGFVYWLCRFGFFEMHGMKQWPNLLALIGGVIILIAVMFGKRITSASTVIGYLLGFILALLFNTDGLDPGGGRTNNAWLIWGMVFIVAILIGIIMDISLRSIRSQKPL